MLAKPPKESKENQKWGLPIRLWHWSLLALIIGLYLSAELRAFDWHKRFGISMASLVLFRVCWGFTGHHNARFSTFVKSPASVLRYLKRKTDTPVTGHSPIGGWSVLGMMIALSAQTISGLFAVDTDGLNSGPLSRFISFSLGRTASDLHEISFNILAALIGLHLMAILYYWAVEKNNLIPAMIHGKEKGKEKGTARQENTDQGDTLRPSRHGLLFSTIAAVALASLLWSLN